MINCGTSCSAGCIRLTVKDAIWIYNNIPRGTSVEFYSSSNPGPLGKPSAQKISGNKECRNWDPTDPSSKNPWRTYNKNQNTTTNKDNEQNGSNSGNKKPSNNETGNKVTNNNTVGNNVTGNNNMIENNTIGNNVAGNNITGNNVTGNNVAGNTSSENSLTLNNTVGTM